MIKHSPCNASVNMFRDVFKPNPLPSPDFVDRPFIASESALKSLNSNHAFSKAPGMEIPLSIIPTSVDFAYF